MPIMRGCLDCGQLVPLPRSRCKRHEQAHQARLLEREPWRRVYDSERWKKLTTRIKRRDGYRCMYEVNGRRCANTNMQGNLSVHHLTKLRLIWARCGEPRPTNESRWDVFLSLAYDSSNLVTLCTRHHTLADSLRIGAPPERAKAKPRKVEQHLKRQRARQDRIHAVKSFSRDKRKDWE